MFLNIKENLKKAFKSLTSQHLNLCAGDVCVEGGGGGRSIIHSRSSPASLCVISGTLFSLSVKREGKHLLHFTQSIVESFKKIKVLIPCKLAFLSQMINQKSWLNFGIFTGLQTSPEGTAQGDTQDFLPHLEAETAQCSCDFISHRLLLASCTTECDA